MNEDVKRVLSSGRRSNRSVLGEQSTMVMIEFWNEISPLTSE